MTSNKKATLVSYLKMDLYRAFISPNMLVGILGVFAVMLLAVASEMSFYITVGVLSLFFGIIISMTYMLTLIFAAYPYAGCFCEDYENKYIHLELIRGQVSKYTLSKVITILLTSMVAIVAGSLLFALFARAFTPWAIIDSSDYNSIIGEKSGFFVRGGHYILYFVFCAFQFSIIASVLSLLASYLSLYISNKLLVLSVPIVSFYFIDHSIPKFFGIYAPRLHSFFILPYSPFDIKSLLYSITIGLVCSVLLYFMIYWKIRRRMQSE